MSAPVVVWIVTVVLALAVGALLGARRRRRRSDLDLLLREETTGLPNRAAALDYLVRALSLAERRGLTVTVLMIVLDEAAQWDPATLAHTEREVARRLLPRLRYHELLAHWGAGQFVVVLPDADAASSLVLAGDLRQLAAVPANTAASSEPQHSISIGLHSRAPHNGDDLRELAAEMVVAAQRALEITQANGPGRIEIQP